MSELKSFETTLVFIAERIIFIDKLVIIVSSFSNAFRQTPESPEA